MKGVVSPSTAKQDNKARAPCPQVLRGHSAVCEEDLFILPTWWPSQGFLWTIRDWIKTKLAQPLSMLMPKKGNLGNITPAYKVSPPTSTFPVFLMFFPSLAGKQYSIAWIGWWSSLREIAWRVGKDSCLGKLNIRLYISTLQRGHTPTQAIVYNFIARLGTYTRKFYTLPLEQSQFTRLHESSGKSISNRSDYLLGSRRKSRWSFQAQGSENRKVTGPWGSVLSVSLAGL